MSYTIRDLLYDKLPEGTYDHLEDQTYKFPDELDSLITNITQFLDRKTSAQIWDLHEEWAQGHLGGEHVTDYAVGVANGLRIAAKELDW